MARLSDFVLGSAARELPTELVGLEGDPATLLSARLRIEDRTITTTKGLNIHPIRFGRTFLLTVGDRSVHAAVRVFAPVLGMDGLR